VLDSGAPAVRQVAFHLDGAEQVRPVKERAGVDLLVAPRRYVLDPILAGAAADAGADVRYGVTITDVRRRPDGRVTGVAGRDRKGDPVELSARFVVGADGVRSRIAGAVGAAVSEHHRADNATFYAFFQGVGVGRFEFHVADGALAGVFPTHDGDACVWICCPSGVAEPLRAAGRDRAGALTALIATVSPALADRMRRGRPSGPVRGAVGLPNHIRQAAGPGWALVGDAGYHRDPITGHGITDAFRDAELLAGALGEVLSGEAGEATALGAYQRRRNAALRETFDVTRAMTAYPDRYRIVALQKRLSQALETEADHLAARTLREPAPLAA
jgi:flavin-dependent dehydrogenase